MKKTKLLTSAALAAALAIPFAGTAFAAEGDVRLDEGVTPIVDENGNTDTTPNEVPEGFEWNTEEEIDNGVEREDGESFVNDGTIIDEGTNEEEADENGVVTDTTEDDETPTIDEIQEDGEEIDNETPSEEENGGEEETSNEDIADKDDNGNADTTPNEAPEGFEWISDEEIEDGVERKDGEDFVFDEDGYIREDDDKDKPTIDENGELLPPVDFDPARPEKREEHKRAEDEESDLTWEEIKRKHRIDEEGNVETGEFEGWHDRDADYILDGNDERDLTWEELIGKDEDIDIDKIIDDQETDPDNDVWPGKYDNDDADEDDTEKEPMNKPEEENDDCEEEKTPIVKPEENVVPQTPVAPVRQAPVANVAPVSRVGFAHTNPKTGVTGVASVAGLLTAASFAFVGTKRKK